MHFPTGISGCDLACVRRQQHQPPALTVTAPFSPLPPTQPPSSLAALCSRHRRFSLDEQRGLWLEGSAACGRRRVATLVVSPAKGNAAAESGACGGAVT
eukprot:scaffold13225_cov78-Phaeocystis_antarctica.AAC.1